MNIELLSATVFLPARSLTATACQNILDRCGRLFLHVRQHMSLQIEGNGDVGIYPGGDHALMLGEVVHIDASADSLAKAPRSSFLLFQHEISLTDLLAVEALTW